MQAIVICVGLVVATYMFAACCAADALLAKSTIVGDTIVLKLTVNNVPAVGEVPVSNRIPPCVSVAFSGAAVAPVPAAVPTVSVIET